MLKLKQTNIEGLPQTRVNNSFSEFDYKILDRYYLKLNLFGYVLRIWNSSPKKVLQHLKETELVICNNQ